MAGIKKQAFLYMSGLTPETPGRATNPSDDHQILLQRFRIIPEAAVRLGKRTCVHLKIDRGMVGSSFPLKGFRRKIGTITCEFFTNVSSRVPRVYVGE
jgi:alanine racemase